MRIRLPWMSRADRARWRSARSLADLGQLVAAWLEGDIASQPGYAPNYGPDPETAHLIDILAAVNRAGYVTDCSQPGLVDEHWEQRAGVTGLVKNPVLLRNLVDAAEEAGLLISLHDEALPGEHPDGFTVTRVDGEPYTGFGAHISYRDLQTIWPQHIIGTDSFSEVITAWQVTIVDPEYGRDNRLWAALARAIGHQPTQVPTGIGTTRGLYVPVGAAGSGKSTLGRAWPADAVLSLDTYRQLVAGDAGDQGATPDAIALLELVLEARLARGLPCYIDATNAKTADRAKLIAAARRHHTPAIAIRMDTPLAECQRRNAQRPANRRVPEKTVAEQFRMAAALDPIAEGFDQLISSRDAAEPTARPAVDSA
ncbi:ATP-binding protein [Streptomyces malaysiensis]|uniref:ATP-binding protein n=1 Tax=Streptomyces malaysiensis TaxID=92644 RepID=UPI000852E177|nr:ATP-binding protein [Streptomyces sp. SPMA113]